MTAPSLAAQIQGQGVVSADNLNTYEQTCDSVQQLRAFVGLPGIQVAIRGISAVNDGGAGVFYWDTSATGPDNGVNVIVPTGAAKGAWIRLLISGFGTNTVYGFQTTTGLLGAFASSVSLPDGTIALTAGDTVEGTGGSEFFYNASDTTTADNGGTIRVDLAGRRWYAIGDNSPTVELFGAFGNWNGSTGTNDAAAIQSAITGLGARTVPPLLTFLGSSRANTAITNPKGVALNMSGDLYVPSTQSPGLTIGALGSNTFIPPSDSPFNVNMASDQTWTNGNIGAQIANVSDLHGRFSATSTTIGLDINSDTGGSAYLDLDIGQMQGCQTGIRLWSQGTGFTNHINMYGEGRFGTDSSSSGLVSGIQFRCSNTNIINDVNIFGPAFECENSGAGTSTCFDGVVDGSATQSAVECRVFGGRWEGPAYFLSGQGIELNSFEMSSWPFSQGTSVNILNPTTDADFLTLVQNRFSTPQFFPFGNAESRKIASFNRLQVVGLSSGVTRPARGVWINGTSGHMVDVSANAAVTASGVQCTGNDAVGFLFDLTNIQQDFNFKMAIRVYALANGGRIVARLWDSSFNNLTASKYLSFGEGPNIQGSGFYEVGSDNTITDYLSPILIGRQASPLVIPAYAFIGISKGDSDASIQGFDIFCMADADIRLLINPSTIASLNPSGDAIYILDQDRPIAPSIPDDTTYSLGGRVDSNPNNTASGSPVGWAKYSNGTWTSLGNAP